MPTENRHIIEKAVFDISFSAENDAFSQHVTLDTFIKRRLLRVVEEVFDENMDASQVLTIDKLEVDLGLVSFTDYQREMEERLRERLREIIKGKNISVGAGDPGQADISDRSLADFEKIEFYLTKGHLPWNAVHDKYQTLDELLQRVIQESGSRFIAFLRQSQRRNIMIARLANQLSDNLLVRFFDLLAPSRGREIAACLSVLSSNSEFGSYLNNFHNAEFYRQIMERLIHNLLETKVDSSNALELIGLAVHHVVRDKNGMESGFLREISVVASNSSEAMAQSLSVVLQRLADELPATSEAQGAQNGHNFFEGISKAEISGLSRPEIGLVTEKAASKATELSHFSRETQRVDNVQNEDHELPTPEAYSENDDYLENTSLLKKRIAEALHSADPQVISSDWSLLLRERAQLLRENFQKFGRQARIRKGFVTNFPESMRRDVLRLLAPMDYERIIALIKFIDGLVWPKTISSAFLAGMSGLKDRLWFYTFTSLLLEQEGDFEMHALSHGLLRQLAADDMEVCLRLRIVLLRASAGNTIPPSLQEVIAGLISQFDDLMPVRAVDEAADRPHDDEHPTRADLSIERINSIRDEKSIRKTYSDSADEGVSADDVVVTKQTPSAAFMHGDAMLRAHELYDDIMCRVLGGSTAMPEEGNLSHYIDELARNHPFYLLRLYRELQAVKPSRTTIAAMLSENDVRELIRGFIGLSNPTKTAGSSDLHQLIEAYASRVVDTKLYFTSVLDNLFHGRTIDFEAVIMGNSTARETRISAAKAVPDFESVRMPIEKNLGIEDRGTERQKPAKLTATEQDIQSDKRNDRFNTVDFLRWRWSEALLNARADKVQDIWPMLLREHREILREVLVRYGRHARVRRRLVDDFPEAMIWDLIRTIDAQGYPYIESLLTSLETAIITQADDSERANKVIQLRRQLRYGALTYLLVESDGCFDAASCTTSLLHHLIRHDRGVSRESIESIDRALSAGELPASLYQVLRSALDTFIAEQDAKESLSLGAGSLNEENQRAYDKYECMIERVLQGHQFPTRDDDVPAHLGSFGKLTHDKLLRLVTLHEELRKTKITAADLAGSLSARELRILVEVLFILQGSTGENQSSTLLCAIDENAQRTADLPTYYARVIVCILHDMLIDFDAITVDDQSLPDEMSVEARSGSEQINEAMTRVNPLHDRLRTTANQETDADASVLMSAMESLDIPDAPMYFDAAIEHDEGRSGREGLGTDIREGLDAESEAFTWLSHDAKYQFAKRKKYMTNPDAIEAKANQPSIGEHKTDDIQSRHNGAGQDENQIEQNTLVDDHKINKGDEKDRLSAEQYLQSFLEQDGAQSTNVRLIEVLDDFIAHRPARLRSILVESLEESGVANRLIDTLPERQLIRILLLLRPAEYVLILHCADLIVSACHGNEIGIRPSRLHRLKWRFIFRYVFEEGRSFHESIFVREFVDYLAIHAATSTRSEFCAALRQGLILNMLPSTREDLRRIIEILSRVKGRGLEPLPRNLTTKDAELDSVRESVISSEFTEQVYISNAGQVLLAPYLPRLFEILKLSDKSSFKSPETAERAVHLLQVMVDTRFDAPEYQLVLNKILCGVATGFPIVRRIQPSEHENELIDGMLHAIIQNWPGIGNTSVAGLREAFLQRQGVLRLKDDSWRLRVEEKAYDMLLDRLPWSYSIIKFPWMERALHVEWR